MELEDIKSVELSSQRIAWCVLALAALGFMALAIDMPVSRWCLADHLPSGTKKLLKLSEAFGHGFGVSVILLAVALLDSGRRWVLPRLAMASLGAGLVANVCKLFVGRLRPHHADLLQGIDATFLGWWPADAGHSYQQGCPSSHVATAVGLAVGLSWLYPKGRWLFGTLAALVALQRIEAGAHFVSDTFWGAAVGVAVSGIAIRLRSLGYLGNKLERWLAAPRGRLHSPQSAANSRSCSMASSISGTATPRARP